MYNKISNPSFKGAFLVNYNKTPSNMRQEFENVVGQHGKIIYDNFEGENNVLYILRDSKDFDVAQFIKRNALKFKYIPEVTTKLQFEPSEPDAVKNYISNNNVTIIKTLPKLLEFVVNNREKCRAVKNSHIGFYKTVLKNLHIDTNIRGTKNNKGVFVIKDKANDGIICFSPKSKNGITYVFVKPSNCYDPIKRYAIASNGDVLTSYQSAEAIIKFNESFNNAIKHHLHLD